MSPAGPFATATAVQPVAAGEWAAAITPGWEIAGNADGGYLLAMATRALTGATGRPDPVTVTAHYLSPGRVGPVRVATQILREGKRFATGTATMFSGDRPVLAVLATLGDLSHAEGPELIEGAPPELPAPGECVRVVPPAPSRRRSWATSTCACIPTTPPSPRGASPGSRRCGAGSGSRDDEPADSPPRCARSTRSRPNRLQPPGCRSRGRPRSSSPPIRANPAPGWPALPLLDPVVSACFLEEDGEVRDSSDRDWLGEPRQLASRSRAG